MWTYLMPWVPLLQQNPKQDSAPRITRIHRLEQGMPLKKGGLAQLRCSPGRDLDIHFCDFFNLCGPAWHTLLSS